MWSVRGARIVVGLLTVAACGTTAAERSATPPPTQAASSAPALYEGVGFVVPSWSNGSTDAAPDDYFLCPVIQYSDPPQCSDPYVRLREAPAGWSPPGDGAHTPTGLRVELTAIHSDGRKAWVVPLDEISPVTTVAFSGSTGTVDPTDAAQIDEADARLRAATRTAVPSEPTSATIMDYDSEHLMVLTVAPLSTSELDHLTRAIAPFRPLVQPWLAPVPT